MVNPDPLPPDLPTVRAVIVLASETVSVTPLLTTTVSPAPGVPTGLKVAALEKSPVLIAV